MIPLVKTFLPERDRLIPALERVLYSGYIAQGASVDQFENDFEKYIGGNYSVSLNSGTSALHIALILAGIKPGDEVISTALTAEPTNVAIKMTGAKIRYADIDPCTGNISAEFILEKINENTKAIMVVDYAGVPVDVENISAISQKFGIPVIEDAAHAMGARFSGKKCGLHFPFTVFSFQAIKHMTSVDGGMLQVSSKTDCENARLIRWFGIDKSKTRIENNITLQGYKYHMNNVTAAIGLVQLGEIKTVVGKHISNGKFYDRQLKTIPGVELLKYYPNSEPSYWLYTMRVENRGGFIEKLAQNGIIASELHKRNDYHTFLNDFYEPLPMLDEFYRKMVHIPCGWWVGDEERCKIVDVIRSGW